jgi:hypothetical protein
MASKLVIAAKNTLQVVKFGVNIAASTMWGEIAASAWQRLLPNLHPAFIVAVRGAAIVSGYIVLDHAETEALHLGEEVVSSVKKGFADLKKKRRRLYYETNHDIWKDVFY